MREEEDRSKEVRRTLRVNATAGDEQSKKSRNPISIYHFFGVLYNRVWTKEERCL